MNEIIGISTKRWPGCFRVLNHLYGKKAVQVFYTLFFMHEHHFIYATCIKLYAYASSNIYDTTRAINAVFMIYNVTTSYVTIIIDYYNNLCYNIQRSYS